MLDVQKDHPRLDCVLQRQRCCDQYKFCDMHHDRHIIPRVLQLSQKYSTPGKDACDQHRLRRPIKRLRVKVLAKAPTVPVMRYSLRLSKETAPRESTGKDACVCDVVLISSLGLGHSKESDSRKVPAIAASLCIQCRTTETSSLRLRRSEERATRFPDCVATVCAFVKGVLTIVHREWYETAAAPTHTHTHTQNEPNIKCHI